jgi:hypothetical protein
MAEITDNCLQFPRFKAALEAGYEGSPRVMVRCNNGHPLVEVAVALDGNGNPHLISTSEDPGGVVTDGWEPVADDPWTDRGPESVSGIRTKLKCRECPYDGAKTEGELLGRYAVAVQMENPSITLVD